MASFPNAVKTFTSKTDGSGNVIFAAHVNDLQDEVTAIEDGLRNGTAPLNSSNSTFTHLSAGNSTFGNVTAGDSTFASISVGGFSVVATPVGTILMTGASAAASGFLLCDGSAVSRTTYAGLFSEIGTAFGIGNGTTTFNVPDLRGRSPMGAGTGSGLTARTLGASVGEESHALSTGELAAHSHGVTDPGHVHNFNADHSGVGGGGGIFGIANPANAEAGYVDSNTTGISIQNAGSGTAHNNVQPNTVVNFMIKT